MVRMTGSEYLAEVIKRQGSTHVFFKPTIILETMAALEDTDIRRVVTHGEKAAAYMADGYARASRSAAFCAAQNVGAANLAAGLRDAYMAHSPVVAITGGVLSGRVHAHITFTDDEIAFGGHLEPECKVLTFVNIYMGVLEADDDMSAWDTF